MSNRLNTASVIEAIHPNRVSAIMPQKTSAVDDSHSRLRDKYRFMANDVLRPSPARL